MATGVFSGPGTYKNPTQTGTPFLPPQNPHICAGGTHNFPSILHCSFPYHGKHWSHPAPGERNGTGGPAKLGGAQRAKLQVCCPLQSCP